MLADDVDWLAVTGGAVRAGSARRRAADGNQATFAEVFRQVKACSMSSKLGISFEDGLSIRPRWIKNPRHRNVVVETMEQQLDGTLTQFEF